MRGGTVSRWPPQTGLQDLSRCGRRVGVCQQIGSQFRGDLHYHRRGSAAVKHPWDCESFYVLWRVGGSIW